MNINREITADRDVVLTIEVASEETEPRYREALDTFRREARIPGFRPGKVPMELIRKRYGREIIGEMVDEIAKEKLKEALDSEKLEPAGCVSINMLEFGEGKPLRYEVRFPLRPEVQLGDYKGLRIMLNDAEVSDEDVEAQLEGLRRKHAHLHSVDGPAPVGAIVSLKIHEVHSSGLQLLGRPVEEKQIEFGTDELGAGSDEQLLGIKAGETRTIKVPSSQSGVTGAPQGSAIITPGQASGREGASDGFQYYSVEATRVEVPHVPDLDDNLAQEINPNLKTVSDLRGYTKLMLMGYVSNGQHHQLESALIARMLEDSTFPIPRGIVESTLEEVADELKLAGDERSKFLEEHYREAERDYRWVLVRDEIGRRENIDVTEEEVDQELVRISERSGETLQATQKRYAGEEKRGNLKGRIFEHRVLEFLAQNAEIEKRLMPLGDFFKMASM